MMSQVIVDPSTRLRGLSYQYLLNGTMQLPPQLLVGETHGIFLRNMTCSDSGLYTCHLAAPVGEQNQEEQVLLILSGEKSDRFSLCFHKQAFQIFPVVWSVEKLKYGRLKFEIGNFQTDRKPRPDSWSVGVLGLISYWVPTCAHFKRGRIKYLASWIKRKSCESEDCNKFSIYAEENISVWTKSHHNKIF